MNDKEFKVWIDNVELHLRNARTEIDAAKCVIAFIRRARK